MGIESGAGVYKDFDQSFRRSINFGYIIIPEDIDRDSYVNRCLRLERFSILVESFGGVIHNCRATKSAIQDIKFPLKGEKLGSAVTFFVEPDASLCIITGVISKHDETEINNENILVFKRGNGTGMSILSVDGNGKINIDIIGKNSSFDLDVRSDDYTSSMNVNVKGNINLNSVGNINITSIDGSLNIKSDKNIVIDSDREISIKSDKLSVHEANESMVRGDELKTNLDKSNEVVQTILDTINTWSPIPGDGGASLKVAIKLALLGKTLGNFDKIKSEKSFLE